LGLPGEDQVWDGQGRDGQMQAQARAGCLLCRGRGWCLGQLGQLGLG
jgi:hypothetical protein